jgi:hypothetical protein
LNVFISLALCLAPVAGAQDEEPESVVLVLKQVPDDFFDAAPTGDIPSGQLSDDTFTVVGLFNAPTFAVSSVNNVAVLDAAGKQLPLRIESASLYREFEDEDINMMRFAFEIGRTAFSAGPPKLVWGKKVKAQNVEVEKLLVDPAKKERYRTFTWEVIPVRAQGQSSVATLEVIVDERADIYYLWYLLPMALIFGLLFLRKIYSGPAS